MAIAPGVGIIVVIVDAIEAEMMELSISSWGEAGAEPDIVLLILVSL